MGGAPSTPRDGGARPPESAEYLLGEFIGEKSYPLGSNLWQQLLELPLDRRWQLDRVENACELLSENNVHTRHLAKILIHLAWCLQECTSNAGGPSSVYLKAINALYISSLFLKHLIENAKSENFEELYLSLDETEPVPMHSIRDQNVQNRVMHSVISCITSVDVSSNTYILHQELLNFMLVAMATQLRRGPSPGPRDVNPFIDVAMAQETSLTSLLVQKLLLNYLICPHSSFSRAPFSSEEGQVGVLQRVGSAAANLVLLPINLLVSSRGDVSRSTLAEYSILVLLVLVHYRKCDVSDESMFRESDPSATADSLLKGTTSFCDNPYCKALEHARDVELDVDVNAYDGPVARVPFGPLFDTISVRLWNESVVLLLYSLAQGNSAFLDYVLVRTDVDTLLMPILETLYNASRRSSNHVYMLLIILLILSQDSTFNASIHKLILPSVPWYQERLLHQTSLGSLTVIILIRTVKYNLSKMRDVYLHTHCLATLANMAPHCRRLSAYASGRLISLFNMLSKKYNKLAELRDKNNTIREDSFVNDVSTEFYIYMDFLRIVLEILNEILTYALQRNPEVIYAIMHGQEIFQPFKHHPRFSELLENIYTVLDFFNSRMDSQRIDGEWSVEKVLEVIISNCRSWRGEGMKMFTQLRFTYEQESQSEEFFIPYIWRLALPICGLNFKHSAINLFPVDASPDPELEKQLNNGEKTKKYQEVDVKDLS